MTPEALAAIAARHTDRSDHRFCLWCGWHSDQPKCDARQALDELAALRSQLALLAAQVLWYEEHGSLHDPEARRLARSIVEPEAQG